MVFKSCHGMEMETDVVSICEGGRAGAPRTARGGQRVSRVSFGHGTATGNSSGKTLLDWYGEVCDASKPLQKKTLSVIVMDNSGKDLAEWRILNAWPCKWVAPVLNTHHNNLVVEFTSFAHEGIERKK